MKLPIGNKKLLFTFSITIVISVFILLVFLFQFKKGDGSRKIVDTEIEGVNLIYLSFNKNNEKKLEIKCLESKKKAGDKLFLKKITATIFKADKLDEDIHISADSGYTRNDNNDFHLQGNALISSPSFTLASKSFDLKYLAVLSTEDLVDIKLDNITARAHDGMLYLIKSKVMKMMRVKGVLIRAGKPYDFQAEILRVNEKKKSLILSKNTKVDGVEASLSGERIFLQFDRNFANLEWALASGNCFFKSCEISENGRQQNKEINADKIKMTYDPEGRLQQITVRGAAKINLADKKNKGLIESKAIEISLCSATQTLEKIRTLARGTLTNRGQDNVTVSGDSLMANYSREGILAEIKAENNCEFNTDDFSGNSAKIIYDAAHFMINISGKDAIIFSKKNIFISSRFLINTRRRQINSAQSVKAKVIPEKNNVLFKAKPLFITAAGMEMSDRGNSIRFKNKVNLFQDDIELHAGEIFFDSRKNRILCQGTADLKFFNENELLILRGQEISFNAAERKIAITGSASLIQAENILGGRQLELSFNSDGQLENIIARDNVTFNKKDLSGKSGFLHWYFNKKIVLFEKSAQISRKDAGTTKGRELLLDLNSNEITVSNREDRAETIINHKRP